MPVLTWDGIGEKLFETGVDHVVLYPFNSTSKLYDTGFAWNGITAITETPSGADENALYADNIKYASLRGTEEYGGTIEAYTYPDEWMECDGSKEVTDGLVLGQQTRKTFGLSYRTKIGNDEDGLDHGYKLHLVYGATASPSERNYETINDSPDAGSFSWEYTTIPIPITAASGLTTAEVAALKAVSVMTIDSTKVDSTKLTTLEGMLYGTDGAGGGSAQLPLPDVVISTLK